MKPKYGEDPNVLMPYEKCLRYGIDSLDDAELLAVILKCGVPGQNAVETARKVLSLSGGTLFGLYRIPRNTFLKIPGVGKVKSIQLEAVGAIAKRIRKGGSLLKEDFSSPGKIADRYMDEMAPLQQETLKLLCLDTRCRLLHEHDVSKGSESASVVPVREILIRALEYRAANAILIHNHPSGDPEPSKDDIDSTRSISDAMRLIGIRLQDHLIIGDHVYVSLRERGIIT